MEEVTFAQKSPVSPEDLKIAQSQIIAALSSLS
jgi:hypothetical protein